MTPRSVQCGSLQLLAANDFVAVERCSCGSIHISVGGITAHVTDEGLECTRVGPGRGAHEPAAHLPFTRAVARHPL